VARNGTGKTSLAKILASKEIPGFPSQLSVEYVSPGLYSSHHNVDMQTTPKEFVQSHVLYQLDQLQYEIDDMETELEAVSTTDEDQLEHISDSICDLYDRKESMERSCNADADRAHLRLWASRKHDT
jgi:ATPase subunit of ABC transporter with duplicated ATPase domains